MERVTFVLFLPGGDCGLVRRDDGGLGLASGDVLPEEDALDAVMRIPLEAAGFRSRRFHPFRWSGSHLYAWVEGEPEDSDRLDVMPTHEAVLRLRDQSSHEEAALVAVAAQSYR